MVESFGNPLERFALESSTASVWTYGRVTMDRTNRGKGAFFYSPLPHWRFPLPYVSPRRQHDVRHVFLLQQRIKRRQIAHNLKPELQEQIRRQDGLEGVEVGL